MKNNTSDMTPVYSAIAAPTGGILLLPTALFLLYQSGIARAEDYFDPAALEFANPQQKTADLHYFAKAGGQQPGTYPVSIWVNNQEIAQGEVTICRQQRRTAAAVNPGAAGGIWRQRQRFPGV